VSRSPHNGRSIVLATWWATAAFAATALAAVVWRGARPVAATVALVLFAAGCAAFLSAYAVAVRRSRNESIGVGGLFFLGGDVAPVAVRRSLLGSLAAQGAVGLGTALARPFTSLAFGVLTPVVGLGLSGLWGARHGRFAPRHAGQTTTVDPCRVDEETSSELNRRDPAPAVIDGGATASDDGEATGFTHEPPEMEQNAPHG